MKKFVMTTLVAIMTVMLAAGALAAGEATPDQATLNGPTAKPAAEPEPAAEEGDFFDKLNLWYRDQFGEEADLGADAAALFTMGTQVAKEATDTYLNMAEDYLRTTYPDWDAKAANAWESLKAIAEESNAQARKDAAEAYPAIRDWMMEAGKTMNEGSERVLAMIRDFAGLDDDGMPIAESAQDPSGQAE